MRCRSHALRSLLLLVPVLGVLGLYGDEQREGRVDNADYDRFQIEWVELV